MQELLWLLLPVAAASGWLAARRAGRNAPASGDAQFNAHYFKGLNYLLNEQPDKAIEVFIKLLDVNSDTVETHLALGNLFRRRGEVDRAIRVHQNLIARPTLSLQQRNDALLELGQDYMRAGLLDRAEGLFRELVEQDVHTSGSLHHLLDIYQQERDWDAAIRTAQRLESVGNPGMSSVIAQYYCEQADEALERHDSAAATAMLKRALGQDRQCVRASILQGDIALANGDWAAAAKAYRAVEKQDVEFLPEVLDRLERCYQALGTPQKMIAYLEGVVGHYDGVSVCLYLADLLLRANGEQAAIEFIARHLRDRPSVRGLARLIELNLANSQGRARENLILLRELVTQLLRGKPVYSCTKCGFSGKSLHWQCPGCKTWNSVKPIRGVEGE